VSWGWWASRRRTTARDDPPSWLVPAGTGVVGACAGGGAGATEGRTAASCRSGVPGVVHGAGVLAEVLAAAVGDPEQEQVPGKRRGDRGDAVHAGDQQPRRRVKGEVGVAKVQRDRVSRCRSRSRR
jgi:hypothetical protein